MGDDGKPYTKLSYANGPGFNTTFDKNGTRIDLTDVDTSINDLYCLHINLNWIFDPFSLCIIHLTNLYLS